MRKWSVLTGLLIVAQLSNSQIIKYSTTWFGPNANPVPEFTDARIPKQTTLTLTGDYYFGYGDQTENAYVKVEIPLIPEKVSLKIWSTEFEHFQTSEEVMHERGASKASGSEGGDLYVQTRIRLLNEQKSFLSLILNSTLKTAAAKTVTTRRYFDTPGYYFYLEAGKSLYTNGTFINEIRAVANTGFMCWETTNSMQDDAPMYGGKIIVGNNHWKLDNTLSGYWGWIHTNQPTFPADYGDAPLVYAAKLSILHKNMCYFAQYQYGIKDFPYHQLRVGLSVEIKKLTPKFGN